MVHLHLRIEARIRLASLFVVAGLLVALASLFWNHPLSFMVFLFVGMPLVVAGVLIYVFSLVSPPRATTSRDIT